MKHQWLLLLASVQWWCSQPTNVAALDIADFQTAVYPASAVVLDVTPPETAVLVTGSDETAARNDYEQQARTMSGDSHHGEKAAVCADAATTCADTTTTTDTTTCATATTTCAAAANTTPKKDCEKAADKIRDRVVRLTDELCRAEAALTIAQQVLHKLEVLKKEKDCYVGTASDKVLRLVDKLEHVEKLMAADANRQQQFQKQLAQMHRLANLSAHRLQVIRRLKVGAEVGLVHMVSTQKLKPDYHKPAQQG